MVNVLTRDPTLVDLHLCLVFFVLDSLCDELIEMDTHETVVIHHLVPQRSILVLEHGLKGQGLTTKVAVCQISPFSNLDSVTASHRGEVV